MKTKCPHCGEELAAKLVAQLAKENHLSMTLTLSEGHRLMASTLGSTILNFEKLMRAVAKDLGGKVMVAVEGLAISGREVRIDYLVTEVATKKRDSGQGPEPERTGSATENEG